VTSGDWNLELGDPIGASGWVVAGAGGGWRMRRVRPAKWLESNPGSLARGVLCQKACA